MFPNLKAELARRDITQTRLASLIGISISTLNGKLLGNTPVTLAEAKAIKEAIGTDLTLEELFEEG